MSVQDVVRIQHSFAAKPEVIFKAWTTPMLMKKWMDGACDKHSEVNVTHASSDLREGGRFEIVMQGHLLHHGEYRKIVPYSLLVFTWNSHVAQDSLVTVELVERGSHTELTLTHERLAPDMVGPHHQGWTRIMGHLANLMSKEE